MIKKSAFILAAGVISLAVFCLFGEAATRLVHLSQDSVPVLFAPAGRAIYALRPNSVESSFRGIEYRVNSLGLRDSERTHKKPENTYRVLVLGDSVTFGWAVRREDTFTALLERRLNARPGGKRYEVINTGVPGYATFNQRGFYEDEGWKYGADLVLLVFLTNDVQPGPTRMRVDEDGTWEEEGSIGIPLRLKKYLRKSSFYIFLAIRFKEFRMKYFGTGSGVAGAGYTGGDTVERTRGELEKLAKAVKEKGSRFAVVFFPERPSMLGRDDHPYRMFIRDFCSANGVDLMDLLPVFKKFEEKEVFIKYDVSHPNPKGHEVMAEELYNWLEAGMVKGEW